MNLRRARGTLVLAVVFAAAAVLPGQGIAARLKTRTVVNGVVVRLVGAKPGAVRYTLGGHRVGSARRAPYSLVLEGFRPVSRGSAAAHGLKLIARNSRTGRRLALIALGYSGRSARKTRTPAPTISFTKAPPETTATTTAAFAFTRSHATTTTCSLDGSSFVTCSSPVAFNNLALGAHALTVLVGNSSGIATSVARWTVVAPPVAPAAPGNAQVTAVPVVAPSNYSLPSNAVTVSTAAELKQALETNADIVVADGVYDSTGPFVDVNGNRVYAQHLGGAVLEAGFVLGGNWGPGHALIQGLAFDVSDPSKVLQGSVVHVWGTGVGSQILDTTFNGHGVVPSGILARQVDGLVVRRVVARNFRNGGVIVDPNQPSYTPPTPPLLEDLDSANVSWPTPRASNGTAEACVWVGVAATVRRIKTRNCAWEGLWVGTGTRNSIFEDLNIDDSGIGIYVEHFVTNATFRRAQVGPNVDRGATCEWADPAWGSKPACTNDVFEYSHFDTRVIGVYLDEGTTHTTVRHSVFVNQRCGAIGNYVGIGNLWDTAGNDYSRLRAGAVPVYTRHYSSC
jgi:hypothetical protein